MFCVREEDKIINNAGKQKHEKGDFPVAFKVVCKADHFLSSSFFYYFFPECIYFAAPTLALWPRRIQCSPTIRFIPLATQHRADTFY